MVKVYRRKKHEYPTKEGALRSVLRATRGRWRRDELVKVEATRTHWLCVFRKGTPPTGRPLQRCRDLHSPGWTRLAVAVLTSAFRVLAKHEPDEKAYQDAVTSILDETSPWHRLLGLDRERCEALLTQIHEGKKLQISRSRTDDRYRAGTRRTS